MTSEEFSSLYEVHKNIHFAFIMKLVKNQDKALDLHQESWMKCWKNIRNFKDGNFRAWLYQITKNVFLDSLKKKAPVSTDPSAFSNLPENQEPNLNLIKREITNKLTSCLEGLNHKQRQVVQLRLAGLDFTQIAKEIDLENEGAAYSLHFRAKKNLELCMDGDLS